MSDNSEIDSIIDQLKAESVPKSAQISVPRTSTPVPNLTDDNVNQYVYNKTASVIESGLDAINNLKDLVATGQDPKEISALAQLIGATTKAIDSLNKINLQIKDHKNNIEVAKLETEGYKAMSNNTTNVLVATRDEIMERLFDKVSNKKNKLELVDADYTKDT
jgi:hypothetical protein